MSLNGLLTRVQATPNAPKARPMLTGRNLTSAPAALGGSSNVLNLVGGAVSHIEQIDDTSAADAMRVLELLGELYKTMSAADMTFNTDPQTGAVTLIDGRNTPRKDLTAKIVQRATAQRDVADILNQLRSLLGTSYAMQKNFLASINVTI